jgi:hypothetical protein
MKFPEPPRLTPLTISIMVVSFLGGLLIGPAIIPL